jgi:Major tropism determinant N-terminal domain
MSNCTNTTVRFQLRRATDEEWLAADPVLLLGEPAYSTNSNQLKIGNNSGRWSELPYINVAGVAGISGQAGVPTNMTVTAYLTPTSKAGTIISVNAPTPTQRTNLLPGRLVFFTASVVDTSAEAHGIVAYAPYYVVSFNQANNTIIVSLAQNSSVPY